MSVRRRTKFACRATPTTDCPPSSTRGWSPPRTLDTLYVIVPKLLLATHCHALSHTATHCHTLPSAITHCHTLPRTVTHGHALPHTAKRYHALPRTATHCQALSRTVAHCHALSHTATHCHTLPSAITHCHALPRTVTHCGNCCQTSRCVHMQHADDNCRSRLVNCWRPCLCCIRSAPLALHC
jgi:hypothetical protein